MSTSQSPSKVDRRREVTIGALPADFLRLNVPSTAAAAPQQPLSDEEIARQLQQQLNGPPQFGYALPGQLVTVVPVQPWYGAAGFIPANTRGRLSVTIVEARLNKSYGLVRMDPYCRLRIGNTVFETPTDVNGSKAPKWNRTVHCYLPNGVDAVYVEIFDERAFTVDERIAWAHIKIPEQVFAMENKDDWYALSGALGEGQEGMINMIFSFAPVDSAAAPAAAAAQPGTAQPPAAAAVDAAPPFTDKDVDELAEMFPNLTKDVITSVMVEKSGNKDAAVNALLSIGSE